LNDFSDFNGLNVFNVLSDFKDFNGFNDLNVLNDLNGFQDFSVPFFLFAKPFFM